MLFYSLHFVLYVLFVYTESNMILIRLAKFLNLKKEASAFAGRVVEPVLRLLNENGLVAVCCTLFILMLICLPWTTRWEYLNLYLFLQDEATNLLRTVIKLYPSSVNRHYNKVCLIFMFSFPIMGMSWCPGKKGWFFQSSIKGKKFSSS